MSSHCTTQCGFASNQNASSCTSIAVTIILTGAKNCACWHFRRGSIKASRTITEMSEPEQLRIQQDQSRHFRITPFVELLTSAIVPFRFLCNRREVSVTQFVRRVTQMDRQHHFPCRNFRKRDVNALFESALYNALSAITHLFLYVLVNYRRRMAGSSSHGTFVAPSTRTPSWLLPMPCI